MKTKRTPGSASAADVSMPPDRRPRERAAHEAGVQHPGQRDVVDEGAPAGEQAVVLDAVDARPGVTRSAVGGRLGHQSSPRRRPAAWRTAFDDALVAGAAAQVARQRLADLLVGRVRVVAQERGHRHDEARRAEAALQPVAVAERRLHRRRARRPAGRCPRSSSPRRRRPGRRTRGTSARRRRRRAPCTRRRRRARSRGACR